MASSSLKDFFVSLGFKVDEASFKKYLDILKRTDREQEDHNKREKARDHDEAQRVTARQKRLDSLSRTVGNFAIGITAAAGAATIALGKIVAGFDNLYFVSQRTNTSVQNLRGLSHAFEHVGDTGENAVSAISSFAQAMRTNPGVSGFVRSLNVATHAGGKARDTFEILSESIEAIQERHPYYIGAQMAGILGISEDQFLTFTKYRKELKQYKDEYDRISASVGLNNEQSAESAARLAKAWSTLTATGSALAQKLLIHLAPAFEGLVKRINEWVAANPDKINDFVERLSDLIKFFLSQFEPAKLEALMRFISTTVEEFQKFYAVLQNISNLLSTGSLGKLLGLVTGSSGGILGLGAIVGANTVLTGGGGETGGSGGGGSTAAGAPKDDRNLWQRVAPKMLGGKDAPQGSGQGNGGAVPMGQMMSYAMDQLRREGVPEGQLRQAAAHLVGQAYMESGLDPNKPHDKENGQFTGYGIYGARLDRRTKMLDWMAKNGYAQNSAEGQMRYMAREAMNDPTYGTTRRVLMGQGTGDLVTDTNLITKNFENPKRVNYRAGAVANAMRIGPQDGSSQGGSSPGGGPLVLKPNSMPNAPGVTMGESDANRARTKINVDDLLRSHVPMGWSNGGNDNSRSFSQSNNVKVEINGASDPASTASAVQRGLNDVHSLSLRNVQTAIR